MIVTDKCACNHVCMFVLINQPTTILLPLHGSTCISQNLRLRTGGFLVQSFMLIKWLYADSHMKMVICVHVYDGK